MLRVLLVFVALGGAATVGRAQEPKALVGEIVLSGTVESVDAANSRITIKATRFSSPSGATKALAQAKSKVIQVGGATQFSERGGMKNPSLANLTTGLELHIAGKELGAAKPFAARHISWTAPKLALPPDPDTPPAIAPFLPAPQEAHGVTLRVINAGFAPLQSLMPRLSTDKRPSFFVSCRYSGPEIHGTTDYGALLTLNNFVAVRRIYGPQNQILSRHSAGPLNRKNPFAPGQTLIVEDVDPAWPSITVEYEVLTPNAAASARGTVTSTLVFDKLPVPGAVGKSLPVNRTLTTALGTQITVKNVAGVTSGNGKGTELTLRWAAPAAVPDVKPSLNITKITTDGKAWPSTTAGGGAQANLITTRYDSLGPEDAQEMTITFKVKEQAPSLQERKQFSLVRVDVPVAPLLEKSLPLLAEAPKEKMADVLAQAKGTNVRVMAEFKEGGYTNGGVGNIWVKGEGLARDENWFVQELDATDQNGEKLTSALNLLGMPYRYWRADSSRSEPGEYSQPMMVQGKAMPTSLNLSLKLKKARRIEHWSHLQGVPVPAPGATVELPARKIEDDFVVVKRVVSYRNLAELPGFQDGRNLPEEQTGLAVVLEVSPLYPNAWMEMDSRTATDDAGRDLSEYGYGTYDGDKTRSKQENNRLRTILLPVPTPGTKTIEMRFVTAEILWSDQTQTVEVKNVPVQKQSTQ